MYGQPNNLLIGILFGVCLKTCSHLVQELGSHELGHM